MLAGQCARNCNGWPSSKVALFARRIYDKTLSQYDILCVSSLNLQQCPILSCQPHILCIYSNLPPPLPKVQWKCSRATTLCRLICTVSELFIPKPHKHIQLLVHSVWMAATWSHIHRTYPGLITPNRKSPDNQFRKLNKPIYHFHLVQMDCDLIKVPPDAEIYLAQRSGTLPVVVQYLYYYYYYHGNLTFYPTCSSATGSSRRFPTLLLKYLVSGKTHT